MNSASNNAPPRALFFLPKGDGNELVVKSGSVVEFCGLSIARFHHEVEKMVSCLSADECLRANKFHRSEDRMRFILGRGFIRALAAQYFRRDPAAVVFRETATGKPFLADAGLDFNVSHSGDCVLVAWSSSAPIGVDVEKIDSKDAATLTEIAEVSFSAEERAVLAEASDREKAEIFHRIWVRKEAIIKAEGVGLGGPLQDFSVVRLESNLATWAGQVTYPDFGHVWRLVDLESPPGYSAALAVPLGTTVCQGENILLKDSPP